jgi:two-component system response regulator RegX3
MRILLVEDDDHVGPALELALQQNGHEVLRATTGNDALAKFGDADFVLLDLGLPDLDGNEVCRRIRATSRVPIIVVSARSEEIDRVLGLQLGADDYVVKPYGLRELLARIEAVRRRVADPPAPSGSEEMARILQHGPLRVDVKARTTTLHGKEVPLTRKEFDLLVLLMESPDTVCTREEIIDRVWDENWFGSTRTLDVHVGTLRNKLGDYRWVQTVRGVGFRIGNPAPS